MSRRRIKPAARAVAAAVALGALLAGCSDIYYDRRETIALGADDALAANTAEQTVDPWPRYSNNNNLAFDGERMQRAVECYRANKVTPPPDLDASATSSATAPAAAGGGACQGRMSSGSAPPASGGAVSTEAAK